MNKNFNETVFGLIQDLIAEKAGASLRNDPYVPEPLQILPDKYYSYFTDMSMDYTLAIKTIISACFNYNIVYNDRIFIDNENQMVTEITIDTENENDDNIEYVYSIILINTD